MHLMGCCELQKTCTTRCALIDRLSSSHRAIDCVQMARLEAIGVEQMKPYMDVAAWHALTADDRPKLKAAEDAFLSVHKICQAHPYDISDQRSWQALIGIRVAAGLGALLDVRLQSALRLLTLRVQGNMQQARVLMNAVKVCLRSRSRQPH